MIAPPGSCAMSSGSRASAKRCEPAAGTFLDQETGEIGLVEWRPAVEALEFVAALRAQQLELLLVLHALGDHAHLEAVLHELGHADLLLDPAHHRVTLLHGHDVLDVLDILAQAHQLLDDLRHPDADQVRAKLDRAGALAATGH